MASLPTESRNRRKLIALLALVAAFALIAIFLQTRDAPQSPGPSLVGSAETTNVKQSGASPSAPRTVATIKPAEEPKETPASPPDVVLLLALPEGWEPEQELRVRAPTSVGSVRVETLVARSGEPARVPLWVPEEGARVEISGERLVPKIGEIRWRGESLQFLSHYALREEGMDFSGPEFRRTVDQAGPHPTFVLRSPELERGAEHVSQLFPLVPVRVALRDKTGNEFDAPHNWSAHWFLQPQTGALPGYSSDAASAVPASEILWHVPVGASLVASAPSTYEPSQARVTVPPSPEGLRLEFTAQHATIGRVRVVSAGGGGPLSDAQFLPASVVKEPATEHGVYSLLLEARPRQEVPTTLDVWAPGHFMETVQKGSVPLDGTVLEVALRPSLPALVVRVDFEGGRDPDVPVTVNALVHYVLADSRQPNWRWSFELPPESKVVIYGDPPRIPSVRLHAPRYDFELVEKGTEDGLPLRRFVARRQSGLLVRAVNTEGMEWSENVSVMIRRTLPERSFDTAPQRPPASDGAGGSFVVGEEHFFKLDPGFWKVILRSSPPNLLTGHATVELRDGVVEVEVRPAAKAEWRMLRIRDFTGESGAKGTGFVAGAESLAKLQRQLGWSRETVENLVRREIDLQEWHKDRFAGYTAAHEDGLVLMPSWMDGRVLVMPPDGSAFYEGHVQFEQGTVDVRVPDWSIAVSFAPVEDATVEQLALLEEPGWQIAIEEVRDGQATGTGSYEAFKISASAGTATVRSLPPGKYVAYYVRITETATKDPSGRTTRRERRAESFSLQHFEAHNSAVQVRLPASR